MPVTQEQIELPHRTFPAAPPGGSLPQSPYSSRRKLKASTSKYSGNNDSSKASRA